MKLINKDDLDRINQHIDRTNSIDSAARVAWAFLAVICFFGVGYIGMIFNSPKIMRSALIGALICSLLSLNSGRHFNDPSNL